MRLSNDSTADIRNTSLSQSEHVKRKRECSRLFPMAAQDNNTFVLFYNCGVVYNKEDFYDLLSLTHYRLDEPIMEILYVAKNVLTRSAITQPEVNRFG